MRKSIFKWTALATVVVAALIAGTALVGNNFRFTQEHVRIPGPDGELAGVLTFPRDGSPRGVVVMIHGDGPVNATYDGLYNPWFEGAADAGFVTLSWSKPGVGDSDGDWLAQTMDDRAAEVVAALDWAQQRDDVPTDVVVLWGASQAGWVLPKVASRRDDVDAVVAVGTAINWLRQGRFNLLATHTAADERDRAIAASDRTRELLERGAPYDEYREAAVGEPMSEQRWTFVLRNFRADAIPDLDATAARNIPVHLMIGDHDGNVDVDETEDTYRDIFGARLTVTRVDGGHSLARPVMEDNSVVGFSTALVWPRTLFPAGTIDDYGRFLASLT